MDLIIMTVVVIAVVIVGLTIVGAALRGMRPKVPEPQSYVPAPVMRSAPGSTTNTTPAGLTPLAIAEIDRLVAAGHRIQAIKVLREHAKIGLKEAKDRIDHWSISTTAPHTAAASHSAPAHSSTPPAHSSGSPRSQVPPSVAADIDRLLAGNQKLAAIKLLREHTGLGLKETKDQIEAWLPHHRL
ncbi:ribosomal protein L7/L12 [Microbacterium sp. SD291]|uniref:ribosomal protein L7/L12 n=1 Tax=Microbacterium sp. SD291 TaxID=2782007 RepID=UPI001A96921D|nr:ribosomal protein L7/L12 [Microbacterium sp. SD291]MBO0981556.1 ribosomal protein L7/L12 [Microbacterium sp. SD291]